MRHRKLVYQESLIQRKINEIRIKVSKIGKASFDNMAISLSLRMT